MYQNINLNIFGEVTDRILNPLLALGCVAGFYNPNEDDSHPVTIFARGESLYAVKVLYQSEPDILPIDEYKERLTTMAHAIDAIPIQTYTDTGRTKFYSIDGKKLYHV